MKSKWLISIAILGSLLVFASCGSSNKQEKSANSSVEKKKEDINMSYKETKGKNVTYYSMNPDPVFGSTATLIDKDGNGLLVDTQFSKKDAENIVKVAKDKGTDIKTIYVSYSDPDYYFGTDTIKQSFPNAKVVATASTIDRIKQTNESKLSVWADTLKDDAPDNIVIPEEISDKVVLDDQEFTIFGQDPVKQTLYSKEDNLLLGGILVSTDSHLFMADTKTIESQEQWVADLTELASLNAKIVIPGHFGPGNNFSSQNISFSQKYVEKFIDVEKDSQTSAEIIEKMKAAYPELDEGNLEMSAKVVTNEMPWE